LWCFDTLIHGGPIFPFLDAFSRSHTDPRSALLLRFTGARVN
jgi:hypothetical protein